jgi:hypothetical protein
MQNASEDKARRSGRAQLGERRGLPTRAAQALERQALLRLNERQPVGLSATPSASAGIFGA